MWSWECGIGSVELGVWSVELGVVSELGVEILRKWGTDRRELSSDRTLQVPCSSSF